MPQIAEPPPARRKVPVRFLASKATLRLDTLMTWLIRVGGVGIIVAVFGMLLFILSQVLPLFKKARVTTSSETGAVTANAGKAKILGLDESGQLSFIYEGGREIRFFDLEHGATAVTAGVEGPADVVFSAFSYLPASNRVIFGSQDGRVGSLEIGFGSAESPPKVKMDEPLALAQSAPVEMVAYGESGSGKLFAAVQKLNGAARIVALPMVQKKSLMGAGKIEKGEESDLSSQISGRPVRLLVPQTADSVLVADESGTVHYFFLADGKFTKRQEFKPFAGSPSPGISSMDFVFGDVSIVFTNPAGDSRVYSLLIPKDGDTRVFIHSKDFPKLDRGATFFNASRRNKSFLIGSGDFASLRHSTTEAVRWESKLPFQVAAAAVDGKFKHALFLGTDGKLRLYDLNDPHPEAGWKAFFGKVWYEGLSTPRYEWQSSGTDEFEPKFSMVPLIFGTLKGTLWAMVFSVPVALLAAIYASQFLHPNAKRIVKPTMEIMASLPSVVLGFLAALWLAPILETQVVSFFLVCIGVPGVAVLTGIVWGRLPVRTRSRLKPGREWVVFVPVMLLVGFAMWNLGPLVESLVCVVTDPVTGAKTADFRLWWPKVTGCGFDQRNSLVVGAMMGFAVIPVIFTIAEDAISNVPGSIIAASHALGASRWQTVRRVVLPVASAGIFSALMIGLGRAVGETMIMVMATGNTPIMEWNVFNGMRTLAANIAVELPEAPQHSTHYRTLFLGAVILFLMTFVLNTVAELLRQRLREKFKII